MLRWMAAIQLYCFYSALSKMYSAGPFFGFAEDSTCALAGDFIRKPAIIETMVNKWALLLPYNATFGPNQTAEMLEFGSLPVLTAPLRV
jgi:hypothetical protein